MGSLECWARREFLRACWVYQFSSRRVGLDGHSLVVWAPHSTIVCISHDALVLLEGVGQLVILELDHVGFPILTVFFSA